MVDGAVSVTDVSDDENGEVCRRVICCEEVPRVDLHACREGRWRALDVAGTRPVVVFSVFKRLLSAGGFSARLMWGRPEMHLDILPMLKLLRCELEPQQMLGLADLHALGLERPDSEASMLCPSISPCHATLVRGLDGDERRVDGWYEPDREVLAELFVECEVSQNGECSDVTLDEALEGFGAQAIVLYLLGGPYGEMLPPIHSGLAIARAQVDRLREALASTIPGEPSPPRLACHRQAFEEALADDLDTPTALLCLFDWVREAASARRGVGDGDLRAMLWMIGLAPPPGGAHRETPSASPARRRRS